MNAFQQPPLITRFIQNLDVENKYPLMLILDLTNFCNLQCPHCPQPTLAAQPGYKPKFFDYGAYTRIIDEVAETTVKFIRYTGEGEPMLNRRLMDMIVYAKEKTSIPLVLTTNGVLLSPERSEKLLDLGMDVIDISLDAFTKDKYDVVRKGGDYHQVMSNVHHLLYLKKKKRVRTRILVNMVDQQEVHDEVANFVKYWTPLADFVLVRNLHTATKQVNQLEVGAKMELEQPKRHACAHLWKRLTIDSELNVKFCAHDWNAETVLSKLGEGGIRDIWFNKKLREIRKAHIDNDYSTVPVCGNCPDWAASQWDYGYEEILRKIGVISF